MLLFGVQLFSPVVHQMTHSSGSLPLSCGNNLAAESPHSGGFHLQDDDMQTCIVQVWRLTKHSMGDVAVAN